jgi:hypothetical protein
MPATSAPRTRSRTRTSRSSCTRRVSSTSAAPPGPPAPPPPAAAAAAAAAAARAALPAAAAGRPLSKVASAREVQRRTSSSMAPGVCCGARVRVGVCTGACKPRCTASHTWAYDRRDTGPHGRTPACRCGASSQHTHTHTHTHTLSLSLSLSLSHTHTHSLTLAGAARKAGLDKRGDVVEVVWWRVGAACVEVCGQQCVAACGGCCVCEERLPRLTCVHARGRQQAGPQAGAGAEAQGAARGVARQQLGRARGSAHVSMQPVGARGEP